MRHAQASSDEPAAIKRVGRLKGRGEVMFELPQKLSRSRSTSPYLDSARQAPAVDMWNEKPRRPHHLSYRPLRYVCQIDALSRTWHHRKRSRRTRQTSALKAL